jgi:HlyD family secretion protein
MSSLGRLIRKVLLALAVVLLLGGTGWGVYQWRYGGNGEATFRTEKATRGKLVATINASGTLVPEEVIDVGAQVAGQIIAFGPDLLDENGKPLPSSKTSAGGKVIDYRSRVKVGTVLAEIDPRLYASEVTIAKGNLMTAKGEVVRSENDVEQTKANVEVTQANLATAQSNQRTAENDYTRIQAQRRTSPGSVTLDDVNVKAKALADAKGAVKAAEATLRANLQAVKVAEANLLKAEGAVEQAQGNLDKAKQNLEYCTIKSPVDGVIVDRRVNIGQTVVSSLSAPSLFLIAKDLTRMTIWASVNEADIGRIRRGQTVYFKVDAYPQEVFQGTVSQIRYNATMTQNVVTYTVVVDTKNDDLRLYPYLTANLQFRVDQRDDVLLVPNAALRYRPQAERVAPEYREAYEKGQKRRPGAPVIQMVDARAKARQNRATVWVAENGFVRPIRVRTGLTDGIHTEALEVLGGAELPDGADLVTGEQQAKAGGNANPFAPKLFGGGKKQ